MSKTPQEHPLRATLRQMLFDLNERLGSYSQTTHGRLGPDTMEDVGRCLAKCYDEPDAYTISELSQAINQFLKREG